MKKDDRTPDDEIHFVKTFRGLLDFMVKPAEASEHEWGSRLYHNRAEEEYLSPKWTLVLIEDMKHYDKEVLGANKIETPEDLIGVEELDVIDNTDESNDPGRIKLLLTPKGYCYGFTASNLFLRDIMWPWVDRAWLKQTQEENK